jgi:fido (protein-threonine AMPylation protein)
MQNANFLPPKSEEIVGLVSEMCANWNSAFSIVMAGTQEAKLLAITRLFHQFVFIHPFLDGNGRTGRSLVRQLALDVLKGDCCFPFGEDRQLYVAALMQADAGDFKSLSKMPREHLFPKKQTKSQPTS